MNPAFKAACAAAGALAMVAIAPATRAAERCSTRSFEVYFEKERSRLSAESEHAIHIAQRTFHGCAIDHVRIVGATEARLDPTYNMRLARRRAGRVADVLVAGGWPRDRLEIIAIGPAGAGEGDKVNPMRRRVKVVVEARPA